MNEENIKMNEENIKMNEENIKMNEENIKMNEENIKMNEENIKMNEENIKMNEENIKMNENKKSIAIIWGIIIVLTLISGFTFAYFAFSASNATVGGTAGNVNLSLDVIKVLPDNEGADDVLITSFNDLATNLNNECVDSNGEYAFCQLYKINLRNNDSSLNLNVKGSVSFNNETAPNLSWILLDGAYNSDTEYTSTMLGNEFNTASLSFEPFVTDYLLAANSSTDFYMLVWVNESEGEQTDQGSYSGSIRFEDSSGKGVTSTFNS